MKPNIKHRNPSTSRRWTSFISLLCFSVFISFFGLSQPAQAGDYIVSINDVTVYEHEGKATFTISLDQAVLPSEYIELKYKTGDGSAKADDGDYLKIETEIVVRFDPTDQTKTVDVTIYNDGVVDDSEDFYLQIGEQTKCPSCNVAWPDDKGYATIKEEYNISFGSLSVSALENSGALTFRVNLDRVATELVSVSYSTSDGTAVSGSDYTGTSGPLPLNFIVGESFKDVSITLSPDTLFELDETFTVALSGPSANANIVGGSSAQGTITNDDKYNVAIEATKTVTEGTDATVTFTVTLSQQVPGGATVNFSLAGGTATLGSDYSPNTASPLSFLATETTKDIVVDIVNDTLHEVAETFQVNITSGDSNANITTAQGICTINPDGDKYNVAIEPAKTVTEGTDPIVTFTVTLSQQVPGGASVNFSLADVSAVLGSDYSQNTVSPLSFLATETTKDIVVNIADDAIIENLETFQVNISSLDPGANITTAQGICNINPDAADQYSISIAAAPAVVEGNASTFVVTVSPVVQGGDTVTVQYSTADSGTAKAIDGDFTAATNVLLTFVGGDSTKDATVTTLNDTAVENSETFPVVLSGPTSTSGSPVITVGTANGTIDDNDQFGISVANASAAEGSAVTFTVTLDAARSIAVVLNYSTADGTATVADSDYTAVPAIPGGVVNVPAGPAGQTATFNVSSTADAVLESDETFAVTVSSVDFAFNGINQNATGTITNNDYQLSFASAAVGVAESAGPAMFTVNLDRAITGAETVTVNYATSNGTATEPGDYTTTSGTLTFDSATGPSRTISVPIFNDGVLEAAETFNVSLNTPSSNAMITGANPAVGTITNEDYSISFASASVSVAENEGPAVFTVNLDRPLSGAETVTVGFATVNGTATQPEDYTSTSGVLTFTSGPGGDSKTISVTIVNDAVRETDQTFTVTLSSPSTNASVTGGNSATGTITNDDFSITINDVAVNETAGSAVFTVSLDRAPVAAQVVTLEYGTANGTATAGSDYTSKSGNLTFNSGTGATQTVTVSITDDALIELAETFYVNLSNPSGNASITDPQGIGTISVDPPERVEIRINDIVVNENVGTASFTVTLDRAAQSDVAVYYQTVNGTAVSGAGNDYTAKSLTLLTIPAGSTTGTIGITINNDTRIELAETFTVTLSSPSANAVIMDATGQCTINVDERANVTINNVAVNENAGNAVFTVTLSATADNPVTVDYATADGTATAGSDYTTTSNTLTIPAGSTTRTISVPIINDTAIELAETFVVNLSNASANANITDNQGQATINIDDKASITIDDQTVPENIGNAVFTVTLSATAPDAVTVTYATANGSARSGNDYSSRSGTLSIPAGSLTGTITVPIINDSWVESFENFFVNLSSPSSLGTIADPQGECTITTDFKGYFSINDVTVSESAGNATFTVTLSDDAEFDATVQYATADNTAVAGSDYTTVSGTVTIPSGTRTATITVPLVNDFTAEGSESFYVNLSNPGPYGGLLIISDSQGRGTINDNDYSITINKAGTATSAYNVSLSAGSVSGAPGAAAVVFGTPYGFDAADTVTLTATDTFPAAGCVFKGWSGSGSGSGYTLAITMGTANKTVTATFNATHPFTIEDTGTGAGRASVSAGAGSDPRFPGGTISGPTSATYLYEQESTITLTGTDNIPTAGVTGSEFQNWSLLLGAPGAGFNTANKNTSVVISGPLSISGSFIGKYMITSLARTGGTITPVGSTIKLHGQSQSYSMAANSGYVRSDTVIDGFSQGALASYTFNGLSNNHEIIAVFQSGSSVFVGQAAGDEQIYTASVPPMVLLTMGRDHKLYYEAYNDSSDLNGDGTLDVGYNPAIDYYGYFDSYKVYKYDGTNKRFYPVRTTSTKKVDPAASDEWSGDFLNYLSMSRMDALRKVLYGGYRSTDTASLTVLERVYIPQDAHSWGKEYEGILRDGFDIREYTPLNLPADGTRHLFANTSLAADDHKPLLRVLNDSAYRIWEWASIERPVAGSKCLDGGSGPDCIWAGGAGTMHPGHPGTHTQFQLLLARYGDPDITPTSAARANEFGRGPVTTINGTNNPFGDDDNYLTLFKGEIWIQTAGNYRFGADGDDAVEVLIDGQVRTGDYGAHRERGIGSMAKSGSIYMAAGKHLVEFRHEEGTNTGGGVDCYRLYWRVPGSSNYVIIPAATFSGGIEDIDHLTSGGLNNVYMYTWNLLISRPASAMTDYEVRVVVADSSMPETNCKQYPAGNYKPIGLLQRFGEPGKLNFGLMTGSYEKNLSGGVLRKAIGSITNEITTSDGTFTTVNGIISTINKLRITGFNYGDYSYTPGWPDAWVTTRPITQGEMKDWGNPLSEMMFEGLRYYAGKKAYTNDFFVNSGVDSTLGLPYAATWDDPFVTNGACARPFILAISDINPSYDSNQLPGVYSGFGGGLGSFSSNDSPPVALNVENEGLTIGTIEGIGGNRYIGQVSTTVDSSCKPKTMNATDKHLGRTRGLCPEEPTKLGSYYSASVAYYGLTHDINPATSDQNLITYMVALASPLPRIEINVGGKIISLVPFAKSVGGCLGITPTGAFQPTNTIVDFYIESLTPTTGIFRVNYEDVEQGADHDMDAIVIYSYEVLDDNENPVSNPADGTQVRITLQSESASGCIIQHMGYIISGTTADGTYLEVVDADVDGSSDPSKDEDYFLDTPPGATPGSGWNDGQPLPYVAERIFTAGTTLAASMVENPLYYAAKWGGFVDQDDSKTPNLQSEWDSDGDGLPDTYFYVVNPLKLEQQLTRTFSDIVSRGVSHVAPVVSVDEANRTQSGDKLYMAFFKPLSDNYWQGNLKKYGLDYVDRTECGRTLPEWTVTDANDNVAGLCDGTFKSTSQSFWSTEADGASVNKGGVGARLLARQSGTNPKTPETPYYSWRNVYTYKGATTGGPLVPFLHANISRTDLEVGTDAIRNRIINFMYGYTYDADGSGNPVSKREWILGDIIHSEPRIIDYLDNNGNLTHRFIAVGANDGMLHVFTDTATTIGGISYQAGDEIFAFIPRDLLRRLQEFSRADTHITMVDGSPALYRSRTTRSVSGIDHSVKTLVFGERAGGRSYWALDVTAPDPTTWTVNWQIEGGASGVTDFQELGYTWSKPIFARMRTSSSTVKEVAIFAAGYDPLEDGFPEGFDDQNKNGKRDNGEVHGVTPGGTEGYDRWNPTMDTMGRGIFVVDLSNGSLLFSATFGDDDGDGNEAEDVTTGINQRYAMMKYSFPADISVIPLSESLIIMYASDLYGQIWRIRYDYSADLGNDYTSASSTKWRVKRIFTANPGSTLASGDAAAFTAGSQTLDTRPSPDGDAGRKMFYSPDVSLFGNDWTSRPVLYVGTGDRQHARYTMISNRMYFVSDTGTLADETDLLNLTCNELDVDATVAANTKTALRNILLNGTNSVRGLYRVLDQQGTCADDDLNHTGEHILSQPTVFGGKVCRLVGGQLKCGIEPIVYFTSYQPVFDDPCNPAGNAFIYAQNASFGTSALNYFLGNDDTETDIRTLKDTYRFISGSSIPSGVRIIMRDGHAAGLISAGGAVAGIGEDGSTTIPEPPGGIKPLLWETE